MLLDGLPLRSRWAAQIGIDGLKKNTKEGADLRGVKREEWDKYDRNTLYGILKELMRGGRGKEKETPRHSG